MNKAANSDLLTITQLVRLRTAEGHSLRDLELASGGVVVYQQWHKLNQGDVTNWPTKPETLPALARALDVDVTVIVHGYARQLGIDIHENRSLLVSMLPSEAENLAPRQAQAVADLIRAFAPSQAEQVPAVALDITEFSPENSRNVVALAGELEERARQAAEQGNTEMAATFDALAKFLEAAMRAATD